MGFQIKRTNGSHQQCEGYYKGKRRVVTLDKNHDSFSPDTQKKNVKSMRMQMGLSKQEFNQELQSVIKK